MSNVLLHKSNAFLNSTKVGDAINVLSIANMVCFVYLLHLQVSDKIELFSKSYMRDGFCVSGKDQPVWLQTHAMCFYEDTCWALAIYFTVTCFKSGMESPDGQVIVELLRSSIFSVFMHGVAHLYIGLNEEKIYSLANIPMASFVAGLNIKDVAIVYVFWIGFLRSKDIGIGSSTQRLATATVVASIHLFFVPLIYGLTFVNCVIFTLKAVKGLISERDRFYNTRAWFITAPLIATIWVEAVTCDSFLAEYGGHFWFDFSIPLLGLAYYFYCRHIMITEQK